MKRSAAKRADHHVVLVDNEGRPHHAAWTLTAGDLIAHLAHFAEKRARRGVQYSVLRTWRREIVIELSHGHRVVRNSRVERGQTRFLQSGVDEQCKPARLRQDAARVPAIAL